VFTFLVMLALSFLSNAADAPSAAADPQLEKRVMRVAEELRCLVCQNQTIADSNAPLAVDLRDQVRDRMKQGASDEEIIDYLVARYGDFVRYRPPLKAATFLLWFGPALLLMVAFFVLLRRLRAGRRESPEKLSEADHARAASLLASGEETR
jgi:cytochrome c-type biogenesis protein CcmH